MTAVVIQVLLDRGVHPARYVLRVWPIAIVPTLLIAMTASSLAQLVGADFLFEENQWRDLTDMPGWLLLLNVVIVAPVLETLLMAPLMYLLLRFLPKRRHAVLASALFWAVLHGLSAPIWGICIFWTFIVFSTAFVVWREVSFWHAVGVTTAIHAVNNAFAGLGLTLS